MTVLVFLQRDNIAVLPTGEKLVSLVSELSKFSFSESDAVACNFKLKEGVLFVYTLDFDSKSVGFSIIDEVGPKIACINRLGHLSLPRFFPCGHFDDINAVGKIFSPLKNFFSGFEHFLSVLKKSFPVRGYDLDKDLFARDRVYREDLSVNFAGSPVQCVFPFGHSRVSASRHDVLSMFSCDHAGALMPRQPDLLTTESSGRLKKCNTESLSFQNLWLNIRNSAYRLSKIDWLKLSPVKIKTNIGDRGHTFAPGGS